jgi:hypothetical protein
MAKLRWRIERDYLELKQEIGLGHFEARSWRGFSPRRYAVYRRLCRPRLREGWFFPSNAHRGTIIEIPALPENYRPRGSPHPH